MAVTPRLELRSKQQAFLSEYCGFEANVEFHRARLKALVRRMTALFVRRHNSATKREGMFGDADTPRSVPIESIVGMISSQGKRRSYLPPVSRRLARAWKIGFCADSSEPAPIEAVRTKTGEWLISGGPTSLLRLELSRAKGFRTVRLASPGGCAARPR